MQQLVHEKVIAAPIWQLAALSGVGPRVGESTLGRSAAIPGPSPYEDITLKARLSCLAARATAVRCAGRKPRDSRAGVVYIATKALLQMGRVGMEADDGSIATDQQLGSEHDRPGMTRRDLLALAALGLAAARSRGIARAAAPDGQLTWGIHVSLAPTWFDPAETPGHHHPVHGALRAARRAW